MDGYCKTNLVGSTKLRSIDLSDLLPFPQTPKKPVEKTSPNHTSKTQETKQIKTTLNSTTKNITTHEFLPELEDEDENGERFGVILGKKYCSVSSSTVSASHRFRFDKQGTTPPLQSAVKRVFSMRRSSSVSERYCKIHDSFDDDDDDDEDDGEGMYNNTVQTRSVKKKKKQKQQHRTGKILKACKRIFGL